MIKNDIPLHSSNTIKEIEGQPLLWQETYSVIVSEHKKITSFLKTAFVFKDLRIILIGAGTSAYIGEVVQTFFQRKIGRTTQAVASTDFVSHSKDFLISPQQPILMISFARSGDSPESLAAIDLANNFCENLFHLIITCNPKGKLTKNVGSRNSYVLLMPKNANDKGLAMTGSFTSMLLAGILVSDLANLRKNKEYVDLLSKYGKIILQKYKQRIIEVANLNFSRVVFLGSGPLKAIARESQLKVQELSDGQVICKYDSFLGLRHGPKAVINDSTLIVYLFSNDDLVNKYEYDLVRSINEQKEKLYEIGIGEIIKYKGEISLNLSIEVAESNNMPEEFFAVCAIIPGQLLGLYKSINLGLSPDSPSVNNSINRVVKGVNIYKQ
ncbi:SIS domain-containing protein [Wocania ichthyoenteri]|uniref:SIS domain-containing protein n=1 Tax=Wocania ichthyoenteri TaxID=1230531 RepID=UPI00053D7498|nr:SIS domain-containing protein [Wocania ichthyoenteri]